MNFNQILFNLFSVTIWDIFKVSFLILLGLYIIFAIVITRQVALMAQAIKVELDWLVKLIAWVHLLLSIIILLVTWTVL